MEDEALRAEPLLVAPLQQRCRISGWKKLGGRHIRGSGVARRRAAGDGKVTQLGRLTSWTPAQAAAVRVHSPS